MPSRLAPEERHHEHGRIPGESPGIANDANLTFHQRRDYLAWLAEHALEYPVLNEDAAEALNKQIICELLEGSAPYLGRCILPDCARALRNGSKHLELDDPTDLP